MRKYVIKDILHGKIGIDEPIILDLLNTAPFNRLKNIDMGGNKTFLLKKYGKNLSFDGHSRFFHSLGVFSLLRRFEASLEEQIAGLLHDLSHSAFSHCIDYILKEDNAEKQSHQDEILQSFIENTEIPAILKKWGMSLDYILNDEHFALKERELPELCADRIDYSLRSAIVFHEINQEEALFFLANLEIVDRKWIFKSFEIAQKFAYLFAKINEIYYCSPTVALMFKVEVDSLKYAMQKKYISLADLYTTDDEVMKILYKYSLKDKHMALLLARMNGEVNFSVNSYTYDAKMIAKSRFVDPLFKSGSTYKRVSEENLQWKELVKIGLQPKVHFIQIKDER